MNSRRILIVEDVSMIADFMALILNRHGYQVSGIVATGEEAIKAASTCSPDLVLMDIKLEGFIDGIEAAEQIRRDSMIPLVFVTAHTDATIIKRAMATGANSYLIKPFKGKDLLFALERALNSRMDGPKSGESFTLNYPSPIIYT
jgi:DNA-binding response OmpR family regulator